MNLEGTVRKENGLWPDIRAEEQEALHREHPELNGGSAITDGRLATSQVYRDHSKAPQGGNPAGLAMGGINLAMYPSDQLPPEIRFFDAARHLATKSRAIREIRRRTGAATDERTRMRLRVLEKAIAKDLSLDQVGKIANEAGDVFIYAIGLRGIAEEGFGDALPFILIEPLAGSVERFDRYAELAKDGCVLSEDEKQVGLQRLYKALGVGD